MLKQIREICREGVHGQAGQIVTKKDLLDMATTFVKGSVPVTIFPHNMAFSGIAPALGQVERVWTAPAKSDPTKLALLAEVTIGDVLQSAIEKEWYPTVSVGAPINGEGKRYLQHLKMCGAEPGAVKGLEKYIQEELGEAIKLTDNSKDIFESEFLKLSDKPEPGKEDKVNELEEAKKEIEALKKEKEALIAKISELEKKLVLATEELEKLKKEGGEKEDLLDLSDNPQLKSVVDELKKSKKERLLKAVEGKIPAALKENVIALVDSLSLEQSIALSDGKSKESVLDVITSIFEKMPEPHIKGELLSLSEEKKENKIDRKALMGAV